ncbi:MAG: host attachment protein [Bdellovibrionales bacterium]
MAAKWIVVADRTKARIFKEKPFTNIKTLKNDLGREKNRAMTTDKPGWSRSKFSQPSSTHALTGEKSPHEDAAVQFARTLCRYLEHESQEHSFDGLLIAAEAKMMGRIRDSLPKHLSEKADWLKKDFGHLSEHEIGQALGLGQKRAGQ